MEEKKIKIIEQAVLKWFQITRDELYNFKETYPCGGARSIFMYLLYKNNMSAEDIRGLFGYNVDRTVELRVSRVQMEIIHHHGRYEIDVENIEKIIEELSNN